MFLFYSVFYLYLAAACQLLLNEYDICYTIITQNYRQENEKKFTLTMLVLNVHNFEKFTVGENIPTMCKYHAKSFKGSNQKHF